MDIGAKEIILVALGFVLAWVPQWLDRRRRIVAHWAAVRAHALMCRDRTNALLNDGVMAPLYRLPTIAFEKAFPLLLVEGELTEEQVLTLSRFIAQVEDLNRGLDNATRMAHADDLTGLRKEYDRLRLKAQALVGTPDKDAGLFGSALALIDQKLRHSLFAR